MLTQLQLSARKTKSMHLSPPTTRNCYQLSAVQMKQFKLRTKTRKTWPKQVQVSCPCFVLQIPFCHQKLTIDSSAVEKKLKFQICHKLHQIRASCQIVIEQKFPNSWQNMLTISKTLLSKAFSLIKTIFRGRKPNRHHIGRSNCRSQNQQLQCRDRATAVKSRQDLTI